MSFVVKVKELGAVVLFTHLLIVLYGAPVLHEVGEIEGKLP